MLSAVSSEHVGLSMHFICLGVAVKRTHREVFCKNLSVYTDLRLCAL